MSDVLRRHPAVLTIGPVDGLVVGTYPLWAAVPTVIGRGWQPPP